MTDLLNRRVFATAGVLVAALALSACGGEQSPPADPAAPDDAVDTAVPGATELDLPEIPTPAEADLPAPVIDADGNESVDLGANPFDDAAEVDAAVAEIIFEADPAEPLDLATGGMVTVYWAGASGGAPVAGDDCSGILTITTPADELLSFNPEVTGCSGTEGIWLSGTVGATAGDYTVTVVLDGVEGSHTVTVTD